MAPIRHPDADRLPGRHALAGGPCRAPSAVAMDTGPCAGGAPATTDPDPRVTPPGTRTEGCRKGAAT